MNSGSKGLVKNKAKKASEKSVKLAIQTKARIGVKKHAQVLGIKSISIMVEVSVKSFPLFMW